MAYRLKSGALLTDADIAEIGKAAESGTLAGPAWSAPVQMGRPRISNERLDSISFKVPHSAALRIAEAAEEAGMSRSGFLRKAAMELAERTLGKEG